MYIAPKVLTIALEALDGIIDPTTDDGTAQTKALRNCVIRAFGVILTKDRTSIDYFETRRYYIAGILLTPRTLREGREIRSLAEALMHPHEREPITQPVITWQRRPRLDRGMSAAMHA